MPPKEAASSRNAHNEVSRTRASQALKCIEEFRKTASAKQKESYVSYVKSLPAMIHMNGLGQTLAMLASRAKADTDKGQGGGSPDAYRTLYGHIQQWFADDACPLKPVATQSDGSPYHLLKVILEASQEDYLIIQSEAALYAQWLKKFAIAFLTDAPETEPND